MRSGFRGTVIGLLAIAASCVAGAAAAADDAEVTVGKNLYMKNCATCHGPSGTGTDGIASRLFSKPPANLTLLSKENGGEFPMNKLLSIVKGDAKIDAHGTREMPVWGDILGRPLSDGMYGEDEADAKLMNIGKFLETIQVK